MDAYELGKAWGLYGKVAVVAGGGGAKNGIGRSTAVLFGRLGARVVVLDINEEAALATARIINEESGKTTASVRQLDVTKEDQVNRAVREIADQYQAIDVWVQIAGGHVGSTLVEDTPLDVWRANIELNLTGAFLCCRAVFPVMKRQKGGKIVLLSSMAGRGMGYTTSADYPAAKAGICVFARQLAFEGGPFHVNVNAVAPGPTREPNPERDRKDSRLKMAPLQRFSRPEDQARAITFLASSWADMITGLTLEVNGGMYISNLDYETYLAKHSHPVQ